MRFQAPQCVLTGRAGKHDGEEVDPHGAGVEDGQSTQAVGDGVCLQDNVWCCSSGLEVPASPPRAPTVGVFHPTGCFGRKALLKAVASFSLIRAERQSPQLASSFTALQTCAQSTKPSPAQHCCQHRGTAGSRRWQAGL